MVRTKGYSPWIGWIVGEEKHRELNLFIKKYKDLLKNDQLYSYEACIENPKLERKRYYYLKDMEKIVWMRKSWKESQLSDSTKAYRMLLKKNN